MKRYALALIALLSGPLYAAVPVDAATTPLDPVVPVLELPAIDVDKALGEDLAKSKQAPGPERYALGQAVGKVALTPHSSQGGSWQVLADGRLGWQLEIHALDATSVDLGFSRFRLPHGAELRIVDVNGGPAAGPYTDADNPGDGPFWTPIQKTDRVRLELTLPAAKREYLWLTLDTVHHGYKDMLDAVLKSGSCNVDVVCPAGDAWRNEIRAVAVVAYNDSGTRDGNRCSGTFVRSTATTPGPLFLSANHCQIDAATARVYFNFQNSTCRTPGSVASGQNGNGPLNQSLFGATMLAQADPNNVNSIASSDFALLRFNDPLPQAANVYLGGWDRRDVAPSSATDIHHPQGDEKRISFENDPLSITNYSQDNPTAGGTHLRVADWDLGTTEQGSSGSGLWNQDHRLVGVLSGGGAACGNDEPDWFGRIAHAWEGLGQPNRRLKDWLDNGGTNAQTLDGVNANCQINVTLSSPAFADAPTAGSMVRFDVATNGGTGAQTFDWFFDNDADVARSGSANNLSVTYPTRGSHQVRVRVTDASGCIGSASAALDVRGFGIAATRGAPQQVCGDNDAAIEPGERWRLPVALRNEGDAPLPAGARALFTGSPFSPDLTAGPNDFGYLASTSSGGSCGYEFVDIANGASSVPTLAIDDDDDGRVADAIALGGTGFEFYGQRYTQAVMSTNGFISFSDAETGGAYANDCSGELGTGGAGPQLRVQHDDLVVPGSAGAGLRYRYFASCPRAAESDSAAQGCHVFQWSHMQRYVSGSVAQGDFEFQAIAYERSGQVVYQYRTASPDAGASATIGITNATGSDPLNIACNTSNAAPAQSALCIYQPDALPTGNAGLRIEQAALSVPALAVGAQATVDVPIAIAPNAQCGAGFTLNFRGVAAPGSSSPAATAFDGLVLGNGGSCQSTNACAAQVPAVAGRRGLYSDPTRGGNGLANFVYNNASFGGAWYTALADRTPTWYILAGPYADNLASVPITRVRNTSGDTTTVDTASETVGRAWVAQLDTDNLLFAWNFDGVPGLELMRSQGLPFTSPNHTQTWYAPSQSGWGLAIESLQTGGGVLDFIGTYLYDAAGTPRWLTGSSDNITGGPVNLTAYRVHCPGCAWVADWSGTGQPAGTLTRTYAGPINGTLSTNITLPGPLQGNWVRTTPLPITTIGTPVPAR
jgi:lysyl endopeptidase